MSEQERPLLKSSVFTVVSVMAETQPPPHATKWTVATIVTYVIAHSAQYAMQRVASGQLGTPIAVFEGELRELTPDRRVVKL